MSPKHATRWLLVLFILAVAPSALGQPPSEEEASLGLRSTLRRDGEVFASNSAGLWHADLNAKQWTRLALPEGMPPGGKFARVPNDSKLILYVGCPYQEAYTPQSDTSYQRGLYLSKDSGQTWEFLAQGEDFGSVLLLPNGSLYAVRNAPSRVHLSEDMGKSWRDITNNSFGLITGIFPDPDHPDLICLQANSIRSYIFQAQDKSYQWTGTRELVWRREHPKATDFFQDLCWNRSTSYALVASLSNYFDHNFGSGTELFAIQMSPDQREFHFKPGAPLIIPLTIRFFQNEDNRRLIWKRRTALGYADPEPTPTKVTLIDHAESYGLWGIHVEHQGIQTARPASFSDQIYKSRDRDNLVAKLRAEGEWQTHEVSANAPWRREIDLRRVYEFIEPGKYRVQLVYDNSWVASADRGEWVGGFTGAVFDVVIEEAE